MAINWGILDTGNIKVETPDLFGAAQRGFKFGQSLGEFAALPQLRGAVQRDAMGMDGGESIAALAQVDPKAAFDAMERQRFLTTKLESAEQTAADRIASAEKIAAEKKAAGIDTPEKQMVTDALAANTKAHSELVNQAIRTAQSGGDVLPILMKAYELEAEDLALKSKAAQLKIQVYYANSIGIKNDINKAMDRIEDRETRNRLADAQQKLADAAVSNVGLQRKKLEAETDIKGQEAQGGDADMKKAAGFVPSMVSGDKGLDAAGKPKVLELAQARLFAGSTEFDLAARQFINAVLRRESGAAITEGDYQTVGPQYIPTPADSDEVLRQKSIARKQRIADMKKEAGVAYKSESNFE